MEEKEITSMNLVQKLASIRRELKSIEKKGRNTFQKYDYLRAEDIAGEMGDRLAEMNVIVARRNLSFAQDTIIIKKENGDERADVHVIVTLDYVFIDGDDEQAALNDNRHFSEVVVSSIGEGRDSGDKAVAKALTNALKYALTQPLMMRIGDDPEADADHDKPEKRKALTPANPSNGSGGPVASPGQLRLLDISAERKKGVNWTKWLEERLAELHTTRATLSIPHFQMLVNELNTPPAGEESQEDIDW